MKKTILTLMLALVVSVALVGCSSDSAFEEKSADAKSNGGTNGGSTEGSTNGSGNAEKVDPGDVACVPQENVDKFGQPNLDDSVAAIAEPTSDGAAPTNPLEGKTNRDMIKEAAKNAKQRGESSDVVKKMEDVASGDSIPVCNGPSSKKQAADSKPAEKTSTLGSILGFFGTREAQAQRSAGPSYAVDIVRRDTLVSDADASNFTVAINKQVTQDYVVDYSVINGATVLYVPSNQAPATTEEPVFLVHADASLSGSYHSYGPDPYYSVIRPWATVPDVGNNTDPSHPSSQIASFQASHETLEMLENPCTNTTYCTPTNSSANDGAAVGYPGTTVYYEHEIADPVFPTKYTKTDNSGYAWDMANYVLPSWYLGRGTPWDRIAENGGGNQVPGPLQCHTPSGFFDWAFSPNPPNDAWTRKYC